MSGLARASKRESNETESELGTFPLRRSHPLELTHSLAPSRVWYTPMRDVAVLHRCPASVVACAGWSIGALFSPTVDCSLLAYSLALLCIYTLADMRYCHALSFN